MRAHIPVSHSDFVIFSAAEVAKYKFGLPRCNRLFLHPLNIAELTGF